MARHCIHSAQQYQRKPKTADRVEVRTASVKNAQRDAAASKALNLDSTRKARRHARHQRQRPPDTCTPTALWQGLQHHDTRVSSALLLFTTHLPVRGKETVAAPASEMQGSTQKPLLRQQRSGGPFELVTAACGQALPFTISEPRLNFKIIFRRMQDNRRSYKIIKPYETVQYKKQDKTHQR